MYRKLTVLHALAAVGMADTPPICCEQPMAPGTGIGSIGGWYCVVNPLHVRG